MRFRRIKLLLILLIFFKVNNSLAQNLAFSRNARTFDTIHSSLYIKGLAHTCLSIINIPDNLPCNPANVAFKKKPKLNIEFLLSNGYSALKNVRQLMKGEITQELIDNLFSEGKIIQIEANSELLFQSKYLNARYTPINVKGLSVVRNEANPDVELSVFEEQELLLQSGYEVYDQLFIGVQLRSLNRKFIKQQFKLLVLGTTIGKELLKSKKQDATYFEPGLTWIISKDWKPRVSFFIANLGSVSEDYDELDIPTDIQYSIAITPPLKWGELELSLEVKRLTYEETGLEKLRFGSSYQYGAMNLSAGIDTYGISGGIFYSLEQINAGVMFSSTKITNEDEEFFTQTVYVQLGWQI